MSHQLVLHHYWRSSCSWRVRWALELKKIKYQSIAVNLLNQEHLSSAFLMKNPAGQVPSLSINGENVSESIAILEWLDETYQHYPLLPQDPHDRLIVRGLVQLIASGIQPLQNLKVQKYVSGINGRQNGKEFASHWILEGFQALETRLAAGIAGSFSFGGNITMADLALIPQCYNALRFGAPLYRFPLIKSIYDRCIATAECHQSAPEQQPGAQP